MNIKPACSNEPDVRSAVQDIKNQLSITDPSLVIYFASTVYPVEEMSRSMAEIFPGSQTVGCTTAGEMISGKMTNNSIVAMAFPQNFFRGVRIEVLENIREDKQAVAKAFVAFEHYTGIKASEMNPSRYVGMMMTDGMSGCEEEINDKIGNLTNVAFIGGSAAKTSEIDATYVFANGRAYTDAAVLVLMEPVNGFEVLKTQSFNILDKTLKATKVDTANRTVIEFNGKPAVEAYAEALGVTVDKLSDYLHDHPLGLVLDESHYFVRGLDKPVGTALSFYCRINEGEELHLLAMDDIIRQTTKDLKSLKYDTFNAIVEFNCMSRVAVLNAENRAKEYAGLFSRVPTISFSTFGESYIGHINQTSTMLLFK